MAGSLLTGLFAKVKHQATVQGAFYGNSALFVEQIAAVVFTIAYASIVTLLILILLQATIGLKVSADTDRAETESHDRFGSFHGRSRPSAHVITQTRVPPVLPLQVDAIELSTSVTAESTTV